MIRIVRATEADAEALAHLGERTFRETFAPDNRAEDIDQYVSQTFGPDRQLKEIQDPARWIEIAWEDGTPVGFFHLKEGAPDPSVTGHAAIQLLRLYVDSRCHGKGVGPALMERSIEVARLRGFRILWLGVWERNFRAQAFYNKYSFTRVGSHVFRLGSDDQVDLILAREIRDPSGS